MTDTPIPGAAAELPRFERCPCGTVGRWVSPDNLAPNAFLDSLDALREEVARLTRELVDAMAEHDDVRAELAALKAQPTDVDALMALADEYAIQSVDWLSAEDPSPNDETRRDTAREALRAKLAARKEPA